MLLKSRRSFVGGTTVAVILVLAALAAPRLSRRVPPLNQPQIAVASVRAEPRSFNRYVARDLTTTVVTYLTQSSLVRINRTTDRLEPQLASSWELLEDKRTYRLHLRPGIRFSDGEPFTAADVVFSFRAIYDARTESPLADTVQVAGRPLAVQGEDAATVRITFPSPFGPGLRVLDGVPMFPKHILAERLSAGTFRSAWGASTNPAEIAGLGPFRFERYIPGQQMTFARNPYFWGARPQLDRVVLEIVPDQDTELLRLQTGEIDFTQSEIRPSDYVPLKRAVERGRLTMADLGVGLDGDLLWLNLNPAHADPVRRWLQAADFRRAIGHSIDRDAFVRTVYLGAAVPGYTLVSPGNHEWFADERAPAYDLAAARALLAGLTLEDRDGDGVRHDPAGRPAHFTLLTQAGNTSLENGAAVIRASLAEVGIRVDVVALEVSALIDRVLSGNYDAAYFRLLTTDTDPTLNADFWLSSGSAHVWNPGQRTPSTDWEREIDRLMTGMATTVDGARRRDVFREVQRIVAREVPALCFAYPRVAIATSARLAGATPAIFRPPVLWNPAAIGLAAAGQ